MNTQIWELVDSMHQWVQQIVEGVRTGQEREAIQRGSSAMTLDSYRAFDLLQRDKLGPVERLLVVGLFAFCIYMNDQVVYSIMEWALRLHCTALANQNLGRVEQSVRESMTWLSAILAAVGGRNSPLSRLAEKIRRSCDDTSLEVQKITRTVQRYFWHPHLTEQWRGL